MTIQNWRSKGKSFDYNSHSIFYIFENNNAQETIVLIHGFPTSSWDWWKIWSIQNKKYNLLCFDLIGFGFSDKPTSYNYSIIDQANLTESLFDFLSIKKVHVLAHDYGDSVAQEILYRKSNNLSSSSDYEALSFCFLNGGMLPDVYFPKPIQKILASPLGPFIYRLITKRTLAKNFNEIFGKKTQATRTDIDNFWELISLQNGQKVIPKIIQYMKERYRNFDRWVKVMQETKIPMRLINGNADSISGKHLADKYISIIPNPDVIHLKEIGHYPNFEAPDIVHKHFHDFLNSL